MKETIRRKTTISGVLLDAVRGNRKNLSYSKILEEATVTYVTIGTIRIKPCFIIQELTAKRRNLLGLYSKLEYRYRRLAKLKKKDIPEFDIHNSKKDVTCSFTVDAKTLKQLEYLTDLSPLTGKKTNLNEQVTFALEFMLYYRIMPTSLSYKRDRLLSLNGNKWDKNMIASNIALTEKKHISYFVDTFCGALGLTMNINADHYIINDYDMNKVNLYLCVKHHHMELIKQLLEMDLTDKHFSGLIGHTPIIKRDSEGQIIPDPEEAAIYLFRSSCCCRDTVNSYRKSSSPRTVLKRIDSIFFYYEKLKDATILNMNAFELLENIRDYIPQEYLYSSVVATDPPYLDTKDYNMYNDNAVNKNGEKERERTFSNSIEFHIKLSLLIKSFGGSYLYYYRDHPEVNDVFRDKDTYYLDLELSRGNGKEKNIKERILTNIRNLGLPNTLNL